MTRHTTQSLRQRGGRAVLNMANMVRRVFASLTVGGQWGIEGYAIDGEDGGAEVVEGVDDDLVDVFQGVAIYARPAADDEAEVIMLHVGAEPDHPAIVALRNEDARRRYVAEFGDIALGEVAVFNSEAQSRVIIKASGEVEINLKSGEKLYVRTNGGSSQALVTKSEHEAHVHGYTWTDPGGSGDTAKPAAITGTTTLEAE
jgi:hypothetical protein